MVNITKWKNLIILFGVISVLIGCGSSLENPYENKKVNLIENVLIKEPNWYVITEDDKSKIMSFSNNKWIIKNFADGNFLQLESVNEYNISINSDDTLSFNAKNDEENLDCSASYLDYDDKGNLTNEKKCLSIECIDLNGNVEIKDYNLFDNKNNAIKFNGECL